MESSISEKEQNAILSEDCTALCELSKRAANIEELIYPWIIPGRSVVFNSIIAENGNVGGVIITFVSGGYELWATKITIDKIREIYPELEDAKDAYIPRKDDPQRMELDDSWFEARDQRLGVEYLDSLNAAAVGPCSGIEYALSYAISGYGESTIEECDLSFIDSTQIDYELPKGNCLAAVSSFTDTEVGFGFGETMFILMPSKK